MECKTELCDFTEYDVLALSTVTAKQISTIVSDSDTLSMLGDLISAIGDNVTLIAGQRERCANKHIKTKN